MSLDRDAYRERMFLKGIILLFTAFYLGAFLWVALHRINYPFEIERNEGYHIEGAFRIIEGKSLYDNPSLNWAPLNSLPFYHYLSALMIKIFGDSFSILRLISLSASLGSGFILYFFLCRTGVEGFFALAGVGLYFGAFAITGGYYDLALPLPLSLFFALCALLITTWGTKWYHAFFSAFTVILSFFTRQYFFFIWLFLLIHWFLIHRRAFLVFLFSSIIFFSSGLTYLHLQSGGLIWRYGLNFLDMTRGIWIQRWDLISGGIIGKFPFLCVLALASLYGLGRLLLRRERKYTDSAMAVFVLGFFGVAFLITSFPDNSTRDLIPIAIALAGLSTWALQHFHLHEYGFGWLFPVIIKLLTILQFIMFFYRARIYIPSDKDIAAGQLLLQKISHSRGEILLPYHNHYARLSGKIPFADWNKLLESGSSEKKVQTQKLPPEILSALEEKRFSIIILDEPLNFLPRAIKENYVLVEELFDDPTVFRTKCGVPTRPQYLYRAK